VSELVRNATSHGSAAAGRGLKNEINAHLSDTETCDLLTAFVIVNDGLSGPVVPTASLENDLKTSAIYLGVELERRRSDTIHHLR